MTSRTPEQIVAALRDGEQLLREGRTTKEVASELGVSEATFRRWRKSFGGMTSVEIARLTELERENARLRRILADKELENEALRELSRRGW